MVAVFNSSLARSSRVALAALVVGTLVSCASSGGGSIRVAHNAEMSAELRHRRRRIHQAAPRQSEQPRRAAGPRARQAAGVAGSLHHRPPSRRDRQARRRRSSSISSPRSSIRGTPTSSASCRTRARSCATKIAIREDGKTRLESLIAQSLAAPLPGSDLPADAKLPDSVVFRDASARDVYSAIGKFTNLSVMFDPTFRDQPCRSICAASRSKKRSTRCR